MLPEEYKSSLSLRYFIELAYHGKNYHGWQIQPDAISVQEVLQDRLSTLLRSEVRITGAGRTDTGVHASQMFAHFDTKHPIDPKNLCYRLNAFLPPDIAVRTVFRVKDEAHARFDAVSRSYVYRMVLGKDPFAHDRSWLLHQAPDTRLMNEAANRLLGKKDFQCFSRVNTDVKTYYCDIRSAHWLEKGQELTFFITADRFLRNMVRAIVGTLVEIGQGKRSVESMQGLIESRDRNQAGPSAPAQGLFLTAIEYPETIRL